MCMFPDEIIGFTTQVYKIMETAGCLVPSVDDVSHVGGKHERCPVPAEQRNNICNSIYYQPIGFVSACQNISACLVVVVTLVVLHCSDINQMLSTLHGPFVFLPFDVAKHLRMPQELAEVDVEHVSTCLQHDVVIVAVADAENVSGHAAASTRVDKVFHSLWRLGNNE